MAGKSPLDLAHCERERERGQVRERERTKAGLGELTYLYEHALRTVLIRARAYDVERLFSDTDGSKLWHNLPDLVYEIE